MSDPTGDFATDPVGTSAVSSGLMPYANAQSDAIIEMVPLTLISPAMMQAGGFTGAEALAYAATITPDWTTPKARQKAVAALTGAVTIANPAVLPGADATVSFSFLQDATGSRAVSWGSNYKFVAAWSNASNGANKRSFQQFKSDGTYLWAIGPNIWV